MKFRSTLFKLLPFSILGIGLILTVAHVVAHLGEYTTALTAKQTQPDSYRFPLYDQLLRKNVKDDLVDYAAFSKAPELNDSVKALASVDSSQMSGKEQLTFWINTYNLLVIKTICDRYPITSIQQLGNDFGSRKFAIGGQVLSINEILAERIQPLLKSKIEPRSIMLICGGSKGYPGLTDHVITPDSMASDMNVAIYKFVNNPENVSTSLEDHSFNLSPYFQWYAEYLQGEYPSVHAWVNLYIPPEKRVNLDVSYTLKTFRKTFDWTLNDTALAKKGTE